MTGNLIYHLNVIPTKLLRIDIETDFPNLSASQMQKSYFLI